MTITSFEFALIGGEFPFLRFIASTPNMQSWLPTYGPIGFSCRGYITEFHVDSKKHQVKLRCGLHKNCSAFKTKYHFPSPTYLEDIMEWMHRGMEFPSRTDKRHMNLFKDFQP